jgi:hypothetical protein
VEEKIHPIPKMKYQESNVFWMFQLNFVQGFHEKNIWSKYPFSIYRLSKLPLPPIINATGYKGL